MTRRRALALLLALVPGLAQAGCGRKGELEAPPGSQPGREPGREEEKKKPAGS